MPNPESLTAAARRVGKRGGTKKSANGIYAYVDGRPYKVHELASIANVSRKTIEARLKKLIASGQKVTLDGLIGDHPTIVG